MKTKSYLKTKLMAIVLTMLMTITTLIPATSTKVSAATIPSIDYNKWTKLTYNGGTQKYNCTVERDGYAVVSINLTNYRLDEDEDYDYDEYNPPALKLTINKRGSKKVRVEYVDIDCGTIKTAPIYLTEDDVLRLTITSEDGLIDKAKFKVKVMSYDYALDNSYIRGPQNLITWIELEGASNNKVKWESTNENVATVNKNGYVTTISEGNCYLIGTYKGVEYKCKVIVYYDPSMESDGEDFSEENPEEYDNVIDDEFSDGEWD